MDKIRTIEPRVLASSGRIPPLAQRLRERPLALFFELPPARESQLISLPMRTSIHRSTANMIEARKPEEPNGVRGIVLGILRASIRVGNGSSGLDGKARRQRVDNLDPNQRFISEGTCIPVYDIPGAVRRKMERPISDPERDIRL
jgi:hypothetical protein